jgi:hypothetical protein
VTSFTDNEDDDEDHPDRTSSQANVPAPAVHPGSHAVPPAVLDPLSTRAPSRTHNGAFSAVRKAFGSEERKLLTRMKDRNR